MMARPIARRLLLLRCAAVAASGVVAGCATPLVAEVDVSLFAESGEGGARRPGRVALYVPASVAERVYTGERVLDSNASSVQVPFGRILDAALLDAFAASFEGGAQRLDAPPDGAPAFAATIALEDAQFEYRSRVTYFVPVPLPGLFFVRGTETAVRLRFTLSLLDVRGGIVWARAYDSGSAAWKRPTGRRESPAQGVVRLAHVTALQLARQAALDVGDWIDAERRKPRVL